ncbi:MAG: GNAT family N-acetyltransferase [Chloroflexi bacterium]|nr:GNAT family N-acetyltransferase [Chloroflexota bacterium]
MNSKADVQVRVVNAADWRDLYEIWTTPQVCWGTLQVPFQSKDEVRKKVETAPEGMYRLVAEVEGKVVGATTLRCEHSPRLRHVAGCGLSVHPDYWNRGVGAALIAAVVDLSDNWLDIKRIELTVYADNAAAIHLYEKFSFVIEGTKRKYAYREGEYVDTHVMARVRD